MSMVMNEETKRWTARRKGALVLEIIQGKTTVAEARRTCDLPPSEIEAWVEDGKKGLENALRSNPLDVTEHYERQFKALRRTAKRCWSFALEKNCSPCWARTRND